ncbi:MAG: hypothetical protein FWE42_08850 [Defluviitaleaceae bacterium]|nr:hypothetical protein [Defluviitaleaceae bacterium]
MTVSAADKQKLRELAKQQAEIAALPIMKEREALWYALNDGCTKHPLVAMEFHGIKEEVYPALTCQDPLLKGVERQLAYNIYNHKYFNDDRVIPAFVKLRVPNHFQPFGYKHPDLKTASDPGMGYMFVHAVEDMEEDYAVFQPSVFSVDSGLEKANGQKQVIEEIIGDILPVKLDFPSFAFNPGNILISMMSMETMFYSMVDYPELFHKAMRQLTNDYHAYMDAIEAGGAILPNNGASSVDQDSYGYTSDLPSAKDLDRPAKFSDVWGYSNSQETVGLSTDMYDEFFFKYMLEISERCGLYAYGCCEPVDTIWEQCLSRMKNLRKLSISPWCNEEAIADMIRGTKTCFHRKPSPNYVGADTVFNEAEYLKHLEKTVKAARGCPLEITFRDITTVHGEPWRLGRAVELAREAIARHW